MKDIKSFLNIWNKFQYMLTPSQKRWGVVVFAMSIVGSFAEMLGVSIILPLVQVMIEPEQLLKYDQVKRICTIFTIDTNQKLVIFIAVIVIVVYFLKNIYLSLLSYIRAKYSAKVQREMSVRMTKSYVERGYQFFRSTNTAKLLRGSRDAVNGIQAVIYHFFKIVAEMLAILCIFTYIAITDVQIVVVMAFLAAICLIIIVTFFRKVVKNAGRKAYESTVTTNKWQLQLYEGIKEILVMGKQDYFLDNYENAYTERQKAAVVETVAQETPAYLIEGICVIGLILAVCYRMTSIENTALYIPQLASFAVAAFRILPSIGRISASFNGIVYQIPAVNEMYENIKEANTLVNNEKEHTNINGLSEKYHFNENVKMENIYYHYPDDDKNVLNDITLDIHKGEAIGLIGASGAGKSTLADIFLGLYIPQKGRVILDQKINIFNNKNIWTKLVGYVPQRVYLLDDTIRRNIALGVLDTQIDDEQVWRVLEQAQMKEFVEELNEGLDTVIGEHGIRFSGGQAQRLAIARALYFNPDILILDEATSALDGKTENALMEAIDTLQGNKTLIIIAHRLTTVEKCDHIYEINNGKLIEKRYKELIEM